MQLVHCPHQLYQQEYKITDIKKLKTFAWKCLRNSLRIYILHLAFNLVLFQLFSEKGRNKISTHTWAAEWDSAQASEHIKVRNVFSCCLEKQLQEAQHDKNSVQCCQTKNLSPTDGSYCCSPYTMYLDLKKTFDTVKCLVCYKLGGFNFSPNVLKWMKSNPSDQCFCPIAGLQND